LWATGNGTSSSINSNSVIAMNSSTAKQLKDKHMNHTESNCTHTCVCLLVFICLRHWSSKSLQ